MTTSASESHAYAGLEKPDTNNATYIGWADWKNEEDWTADYYIKNKKEFFEHLDRMNQGLQNGYRINRPYQTFRMNRDLIATLADKLELTAQQRGKAINLFTALDLQKLGHSVNLVAYCVCAYVVHSDQSDRECHPQTIDSDSDFLFTELQTKLGISRERFTSVFGKVAHRIRIGCFDPVDHDKYQLDKAQQFQWREYNDDKDEGWL